MGDVVSYSVTDRTATITLDSPANRNALSATLVEQLGGRLEAASADERVRAVVLAHTGNTFCSGADLREQAAPDGPEQGTRRMLALFEQLLALPKPVIAAIDGHVRAGGLGIVGACDIALAGPAATFAFSEVRLGLAPAMISLMTFGRMSERAAAYYCLTGASFDAPSAAASGLITTAAQDLPAELSALCARLRACSPQGLAQTKLLTTQRTRALVAEHAPSLRALSQRLFQSQEAQEGMRAFQEKRPPSWAADGS